MGQRARMHVLDAVLNDAAAWWAKRPGVVKSNSSDPYEAQVVGYGGDVAQLPWKRAS